MTADPTDGRGRGRQRDRPAGKRQCRSCGSAFVGETWQRLCWKCWREERDEQTLEAAWKQGYDHGYEIGHRDGWRAGLEDRPDIEPDLLERAVRLTHPDRHPAERAAEANAVTAQLLGLRSDQKRRAS